MNAAHDSEPQRDPPPLGRVLPRLRVGGDSADTLAHRHTTSKARGTRAARHDDPHPPDQQMRRGRLPTLSELDDLRADVERLTSERDRAREECGHEKAMRASQREEMMHHFAKRQEAERALVEERARVARVEKLADALEVLGNLTIERKPDGLTATIGACEALCVDLRAALAGDQ